MKVLITGSNGLLGQKIIGLLEHDKLTVIATGRGENRNPAGNYKYYPLDITSSDAVESLISTERPDVVINTAAMTHVDQCEQEMDLCWQLNVEAVQFLINACQKIDAFLIHISTDFIFDGKAGPYQENDKPNPLSHYAESKLASEKLLENASIDFAIVRTMLVYGIAHDMSRSNIILWVKKSLEEGKQIKVVNDQWRTPTLAEDLAKACITIAKGRVKGTFHISGKDMLTPYDMAIATAKHWNLDKDLIEEVDGSIFTQPAKRPPKTGFILDKAKRELAYEPVTFQKGLSIVENQLKEVSEG
ncbi:MAG: SDR family oxidoreductase [Cyclobacteriaceae bacterium]